MHGQAIYIDPAAEMVIVRFASNPLSSNKYIDPVSIPAYEAVADYLMGNTPGWIKSAVKAAHL